MARSKSDGKRARRLIVLDLAAARGIKPVRCIPVVRRNTGEGVAELLLHRGELRRDVRVRRVIHDPEIIVVVARPGRGHTDEDVELEQLAKRPRTSPQASRWQYAYAPIP